MFAYLTGGLCARVHVQNKGWMGWDCKSEAEMAAGDGVEVGTTGEGLQIEAVELYTGESFYRARAVCAKAHVQNIGWMS